jgi:sialate O-acetylesterase
MKRIHAIGFIILFALGLALRADVTLAPLFRDGAIFQREKPVPVWGLAKPGEKITVTFAGQTHETAAGKDGRWMVRLAPLRANAKPAELVAKGNNELRVRDILVGEVWFCSGQSNMNWPVKLSLNAEAEIAAASNPLIRCFGVRNEVEETPQFDTKGEWQPATSEYVNEFSAVAYFFARELQPCINMPVGLVKGTPGGSSIEAWMSIEALGGQPSFDEIMTRRNKVLADFPAKKAEYDRAMIAWKESYDNATAAGESFNEPRPRVPEGPKSRNAPAGLYNGNVHPFLPYAIRGFLWYQGEANASRYADYRTLFPAMIRQWRRDFQQEDVAFYFVQLANFNVRNDPTGRQWAFQREAQMSALKLPNTAMAVTIDIGEENDIHPKNKQEVGRRLSLIARHHLYGEAAEVDGEGPRAIAFDIKENEIRVRLASTGGGIVQRGRKVWDLEVAGADRDFRPATVKIEGDTLVVSAKDVARPAAVRYLWKNTPDATLFNGDGLPVAPFRSDNWEQ